MSAYLRLAAALAHNLARRAAEVLADRAAGCRRRVVYKLRSIRRGYDDTGPPAPTGQAGWTPTEGELAAIVESVCQKPWFCKLDRRAAEDLVRQGGDGCFLIRPSSSIRALTLTLWHHHRPFNILIRQREDGLLALGSRKSQEMTFHSVDEMVRHHEREALLLYSGGEPAGRTKLRAPPPGLAPHPFVGRQPSDHLPEGTRAMSTAASPDNAQVHKGLGNIGQDVQGFSCTENPFVNRKLPELPVEKITMPVDEQSEYTFL